MRGMRLPGPVAPRLDAPYGICPKDIGTFSSEWAKCHKLIDTELVLRAKSPPLGVATPRGDDTLEWLRTPNTLTLCW